MNLEPPDTDFIVVSIALGAVCIPLWFLLWHSNANLVLEQRDLVDQHFPAHALAMAQMDDDPEPPKPKPAAVTENCTLVALRKKIEKAQKILDQ